MTEVWVLVVDYGYEGGENVQGVYSSEAMALAAEVKPEAPFDVIFAYRVTVDAPASSALPVTYLPPQNEPSEDE